MDKTKKDHDAALDRYVPVRENLFALPDVSLVLI
jgi:hypothetical protein